MGVAPVAPAAVSGSGDHVVERESARPAGRIVPRAQNGAAPSAHAPRAPAAKVAATTEPGGYVVGAGDSLWSIGEHLLRARGEAASPAAVARMVHELWVANRSHIASGSPDLIEPGTRLTLPPG